MSRMKGPAPSIPFLAKSAERKPAENNSADTTSGGKFAAGRIVRMNFGECHGSTVGLVRSIRLIPRFDIERSPEVAPYCAALVRPRGMRFCRLRSARSRWLAVGWRSPGTCMSNGSLLVNHVFVGACECIVCVSEVESE